MDLAEMLQTVSPARHKVVGLVVQVLPLALAGNQVAHGVETQTKAVGAEAEAVGCGSQVQTLINYVNLAAVEVGVEALLETQIRRGIRAVQLTQQHSIANP